MNSMSVKIPKPDHPIHDLILHRWSPRAFANRPVELEKLFSLFEAARWAASSANEQPWSFVVATHADTAAFEGLASCLNPGNSWAKNAPVLALSIVKLNFTHSGGPNRTAWHDVGLAVGNLSVEATSLGLHLHQMAGINSDTARQVCEIPETHAPVAMIAIGYLGDPSTLNDELKKREEAPRHRKPIREFVFSGKFGHPGL
jgi:nitroreductase